MRRDVEELIPVVMKVLSEAEAPMPCAEIARACGSDVWLTRAAINALRGSGVAVAQRPGQNGGYYLPDRVDPGAPRRRTDPKFRNLVGIEQARAGQYSGGIEALQYPVDWVAVDEYIRRLGKSDWWLATTAEKLSGRKSFWEVIRIALRGALKERSGTGAPMRYRRMTWPNIAVLAKVLDVPPECLIDEEFMMWHGAPSGIPRRFAGHKLLFGAVRRGYHPLDLIPPFWDPRIDPEEVKANQKAHPKVVKAMKLIYSGEYRYMRTVNTLLYMCEKAGVTLADLFVGFRRRGTEPLADLHNDVATLRDADVAFLAGVAKLLAHRRIADDREALLEGLERLVVKREELLRCREEEKEIKEEAMG